MKAKSKPGFARAPVATRTGEFVARYSDSGLARLSFPGRDRQASDGKASLSRDQRSWHRLTVHAVRSVLTGKNPAKLPPLDLGGGTDFQRAVWRQMQRLKVGQTISYGELAAALRKPGAARAVGAACGANPIPVLIPCHRILAAAGRLGGFSGGLEAKRELLANEGIAWEE